MDKLILGIDMDDTIFGLMQAVIEPYNKKYNDNLALNDFTEYSVKKFIKKECNNIFEEFASDDVMENLQIKDGALDAINFLHKYFRILFLTAGHPYTAKARDKLLTKTFSWYKSGQLVLCKDKKLVRVDALIDDYENNLIGGAYKKILFNAPWNENFNEKEHGITRVMDWEDAIDVLLPIVKCKDEPDKECFDCEQGYSVHGYPSCSNSCMVFQNIKMKRN